MLQILIGTDIPFMKYRRKSPTSSRGALLVATVAWLAGERRPQAVAWTSPAARCCRSGSAGRCRPTTCADARRGRARRRRDPERPATGDEFLLRFAAAGHRRHRSPGIQAGRSRPASPAPPSSCGARRRSGPRSATSCAQKAVWAVLGSLLGILLYVGIRYEFKFALGAVRRALPRRVRRLRRPVLHRARDLASPWWPPCSPSPATRSTTPSWSSTASASVQGARARRPHERVMDIAVNETLSRTIITSLTVFLSSARALHLGRRGDQRLLVRHAGRRGVRHLLLGLRG